MPSSRIYATAGAFRRALEERLKRASLTDQIDPNRLRRQVSFDRLLARLFREEPAPWVLKGGYVLELRFKAARSTVDIDLTVQRRRLPNHVSRLRLRRQTGSSSSSGSTTRGGVESVAEDQGEGFLRTIVSWPHYLFMPTRFVADHPGENVFDSYALGRLLNRPWPNLKDICFFVRTLPRSPWSR